MGQGTDTNSRRIVANGQTLAKRSKLKLNNSINYFISEAVCRRAGSSDKSSLSKISVWEMNQILDKLKLWQSRESTKRNYLSIWRQFNTFTLKLDKKPKSWEHCMSLYGAYLFEQGIKSTTLHSYLSAVKHVLT